MPYNGGLLGRWQNPYQQRDPFQQLPQAPPPMPAPVMNGGFGPNPTHPIGMAPMQRQPPARPPGPAMPRPLSNPGMFQPTPPPMPETPFQMAPIDPSGAPYRQQVSNQLEMPNDPALAAYDPATAAYPTQVQRQPQPGDQATDAQAQQGQQSAGKFFGLDGSDWITMGMALMGGAQNGGDWSMPLQAFQGIQRGNKEEERYQQEMKRQAELDRMQKELHPLQVDAAKAQVLAAQNANTWGKEDRVRDNANRDQSKSIAARLLGSGSVKDPTAMAMLQLAEQGIVPVTNALERIAGVDDAAIGHRRAMEVARLQAEIQAAAADRNVTLAAEKQKELLQLERDNKNYDDTVVRQEALQNLYNAKNYINTLIGSGKSGKLGIDTNQTLTQLFDPETVSTAVTELRGLAVDRAMGKLRLIGGNDTNQDFMNAMATIGSPEAPLKAQIAAIDRQIAVNEEAIKRYSAEREWVKEKGPGPQSLGAFSEQYYGLNNSGAGRAAAATAPANSSSSSAPPQNAIIYLQQNDTPQMRRDFDAKYGAGAAMRVLGGARNKGPSTASQQFGGY